jgi:phosphate uptake regulator
MVDDLLKFDFGFTAVDEDEIDAVVAVTASSADAASEVKELEDKVNNLYNAILPLLSNLKQNPEKEYIKWPDRTAKIEAFEDHIRKIIE